MKFKQIFSYATHAPWILPLGHKIISNILMWTGGGTPVGGGGYATVECSGGAATYPG